MDETFYDRHLPMISRPVPKSRALRMLGIEQWKSRKQRSTAWQAFMRPWIVIAKPTVFLSMLYYSLTFAWVIGINTTLAIFVTPLYGFGLKQVGLFYFTPIVAALIGEVTGHWLHDLFGNLYMRRHGGVLEPEARLLPLYIATPFVVSGLVLIGFCLQNGYHYMITALAWGLYVFGTMLSTVAVASYNLDSYPEASGEMGAWLNLARALGGFVMTYVQVRWAEGSGTERSFGVQAGVSLGAFLLVVVLQIWGKRLRTWSGRLHFKTS